MMMRVLSRIRVEDSLSVLKQVIISSFVASKVEKIN